MRRSRAEWAKILDAYEGSDEGPAAFARRHGINLGTLYSQIAARRRLREIGERRALLPVRVVGSPTASGAETLEAAVEVIAVRLAAGHSSHLVREVLEKLRSC